MEEQKSPSPSHPMPSKARIEDQIKVLEDAF